MAKFDHECGCGIWCSLRDEQYAELFTNNINSYYVVPQGSNVGYL